MLEKGDKGFASPILYEVSLYSTHCLYFYILDLEPYPNSVPIMERRQTGVDLPAANERAVLYQLKANLK
jgi:hypothetical protein